MDDIIMKIEKEGIQYEKQIKILCNVNDAILITHSEDDLQILNAQSIQYNRKKINIIISKHKIYINRTKTEQLKIESR